MQLHHDFLLTGLVAVIVNNERRSQQELLLQAFMRVHPERPAEAGGSADYDFPLRSLRRRAGLR